MWLICSGKLFGKESHLNVNSYEITNIKRPKDPFVVGEEVSTQVFLGIQNPL